MCDFSILIDIDSSLLQISSGLLCYDAVRIFVHPTSLCTDAMLRISSVQTRSLGSELVSALRTSCLYTLPCALERCSCAGVSVGLSLSQLNTLQCNNKHRGQTLLDGSRSCSRIKCSRSQFCVSRGTPINKTKSTLANKTGGQQPQLSHFLLRNTCCTAFVGTFFADVLRLSR